MRIGKRLDTVICEPLETPAEREEPTTPEPELEPLRVEKEEPVTVEK